MEVVSAIFDVMNDPRGGLILRINQQTVWPFGMRPTRPMVITKGNDAELAKAFAKAAIILPRYRTRPTWGARYKVTVEQLRTLGFDI
ncbi:hypothetical protein SAMN05444167_0549 [Terriglobus roseus]|uniref:Uncharacterized protein n=1 Tax=Terriglobus roseus TaxID=392734 RepID=A0A1G7G4E8_9BACT|nr:hypothetical protein SAMN05444167_0549 [Terriglobus roseus]